MICGIGLPWTDTCTHPAGHLGRCSWDDRRTVDPVYEEHTTPNLLDPNEVRVNDFVLDHGTRYRYRMGCHCQACRKANTDYHAEYRAGQRTRSVDSPA